MEQKEFLRGDSSWIALALLSRLFGFPISEYFIECTDQSIACSKPGSACPHFMGLCALGLWDGTKGIFGR